MANDNNAAAATPDEKWALISRDIPRGEGEGDFVVGEDEIRAILAAGRDVNLYWGTGARAARLPCRFPAFVCSCFFSLVRSDDGSASRGLLCSHLQDWGLSQGRLPRHDLVCRPPRLSRQHEEVRQHSFFFFLMRFASGLCGAALKDDRFSSN